MPQNSPRKKVVTSQPSRKRKNNITAQVFRWLNQKLEIDEKISMGTFKKVVWLMGLTVIYIFFQHNFDSLIRKLNKADTQLNEQRAAYISHKSKYLYASKQSEVEKKLEIQGFKDNQKPPVKIAIKNH
ncbi:MAG: hypothetical protein IPP05_17360 [Cytophagaceae bacterium]|nr:hypothetical protein [Cytophagaceae bacterium]